VDEETQGERMTEAEILKATVKVFEENTCEVELFHNGETNAKNFLRGQVMRKTEGKADPAKVLKVVNLVLSLEYL
jgi:aspartyl-tRNA(Asn)/glutamyl-tRNA(Gln) amidotransferase subunit B